MFKVIDKPLKNFCSTQGISLFTCMQMAEPEQSPHVSTWRLLQFRHANGMRRNNYCRICLRGALMGPKLSTQTSRKRKGMRKRQRNRKREWEERERERQGRGVSCGPP